MMEEGTAIHIAIHNNLAHGVPQSLAVRWLRPLSAGCLQTEDLGSYMNQFTAETVSSRIVHSVRIGPPQPKVISFQ